MFNLGNLLTVLSLSMGVASTTPIVDRQESTHLATERNATSSENINDYQIALTEINNGTTTLGNVYVQEQQLGNDEEIEINYRNTTNYINVLATQYKTSTYRQIGSSYKYYYQNYETIENNLDNYYGNCKQNLLVMQITPYNYNINTETSLVLTLDVDGWVDNQGNEISLEQQHLLSNIYTSTQDWANYLNRTFTSFTAQGIINDITDVNNNFLYTKVSNIEAIDNLYSTLTFDIPLTPNETNYVVLQLIPVVKCQYYDYADDQWQDFGTLVSTIPLEQYSFNVSSIVITGTNIIPQGGTYEVIDIPGLMWEILTMPFAFVSQAFNLTLFPGTPYQLNISNLFLSIIAVLVFVWLIAFIIKVKG